MSWVTGRLVGRDFCGKRLSRWEVKLKQALNKKSAASTSGVRD